MDDPADSLPRIDVNPDGVKPHLRPKWIAQHVNLDRPGGTARTCVGEAGEREPAGREEVSPCQHERAAYLSAAAFSGETYHMTTW